MNLENLKKGETLLIGAKGVSGGKVQLEFAQIVDTGRKAADLTSILNADDPRFNQAKPRHAWITGSPEMIKEKFGIDVSGLSEGQKLSINKLNPEVDGKQCNLQIVETINGSDYDEENYETRAKRAGADGDFIMKKTESGLKYIYTKVSVVAGEPSHFFFPREDCDRQSTGSVSAAIAEALGE